MTGMLLAALAAVSMGVGLAFAGGSEVFDFSDEVWKGDQRAGFILKQMVKTPAYTAGAIAVEEEIKMHRHAVDGRVKISFQPIRNPVTKAEANPKVVLPQGFVFQEGNQYALKEFWVNDGPELSFAHPGKCGELAKVRWQGP